MKLINKRFSIKKSLFFSFIIIVLLLTSIELIQRIRYYFRFRSSYWLFYGFTEMPRNYDDMLRKGINKRLGRDIELIEIPVISYGEKTNIYRKYNPNTNVYGKINSHGFRGKEFSIEKEDNVYRIVAFGGSTTFGYGTEDGFTYPEFLERILNSNNLTKRFEVINAGICGAAIKEIANLFKTEIIPLNPDLIVINNIYNNVYYAKAAYKVNSISLQRVNRVLLEKSVFYMSLREKLSILFNHKMDDIYRVSMQKMINNLLKDNSFWEDLEYDFKNIIHIAKSHNIEVVIIKEPIMLGSYGEDSVAMMHNKDFAPIYQRIYTLLDDIASSEKIIIVNVADDFNRSSEMDLLFQDGLHLTNRGNEYLAQLVSENILGDYFMNKKF